MLLGKRKATDESISILSEGTEISGEISFIKGMHVNGVVKGKIRSEAALEIGPAGKINAEVNVGRISIMGEFHGVITAADRVEIHKDGKVFGDIYSPCLIIASGATFEGRCNMSEKIAPKQLDGTLKAIPAEPGRTSPGTGGS